jgi:hypothetical protein
MAMSQQLSNLKVGGDAHSKAARRPDGVAGEKTAEVDNVKNIRKVLSVNLKLHIHRTRMEDRYRIESHPRSRNAV